MEFLPSAKSRIERQFYVRQIFWLWRGAGFWLARYDGQLSVLRGRAYCFSNNIFAPADSTGGRGTLSWNISSCSGAFIAALGVDNQCHIDNRRYQDNSELLQRAKTKV